MDAGSRRARLAQLRNRQAQESCEVKLEGDEPMISVGYNLKNLKTKNKVTKKILFHKNRSTTTA